MYVDCISGFGTIMEAEEQEMSPVSDACQQLTEGLLALSSRDNIPLTAAPSTTAPAGAAITFSSAQFVGASAVRQPAVVAGGVFAGQPTYNMGVTPAQPMSAAVGSPFVIQHQLAMNAVLPQQPVQPLNPVMPQHQPLNPLIINHSGLRTTV